MTEERPYYVRYAPQPSMVMFLAPERLSYAKMKFVEWVRDDTGQVSGMRVECDLGHGYGFDAGTREEILRPGRSSPSRTSRRPSTAPPTGMTTACPSP